MEEGLFNAALTGNIEDLKNLLSEEGINIDWKNKVTIIYTI